MDCNFLGECVSFAMASLLGSTETCHMPEVVGGGPGQALMVPTVCSGDMAHRGLCTHNVRLYLFTERGKVLLRGDCGWLVYRRAAHPPKKLHFG